LKQNKLSVSSTVHNLKIMATIGNLVPRHIVYALPHCFADFFRFLFWCHCLILCSRWMTETSGSLNRPAGEIVQMASAWARETGSVQRRHNQPGPSRTNRPGDHRSIGVDDFAAAGAGSVVGILVHLPPAAKIPYLVAVSISRLRIRLARFRSSWDAQH
jgi:hypothetical protein